jgi:hypothetical protein
MFALGYNRFETRFLWSRKLSPSSKR